MINTTNQDDKHKDAPLTVIGEHEETTIKQMQNCMSVGNVVAGVICADGHLGYAQPVGGVIAYEDQISISGVGFDIACGNKAVKLDVKYDDIKDRVNTLLDDIKNNISFGIGQVNNTKVEDELFDNDEAWKEADREDYKKKAQDQLGTVGGGNHYVDLLYDDDGFVWIGVHFGSRGLGHTTATKYIKALGGKDGVNVLPSIVNVHSELGKRYIVAMNLAGDYAYAGRTWVVERVRSMIGGKILDQVHNHHNFAWAELHNGKYMWVVRKGATPAFPGQRGFVGGSMGDDAVIIEGVQTQESARNLYSTVHGAGRFIGRKDAKRQFTQSQMDMWLRDKGVIRSGGDLDESPMAYRRLPDVLRSHGDTIKVTHTLKPFLVAMAGNNVFDPFKD